MRKFLLVLGLVALVTPLFVSAVQAQAPAPVTRYVAVTSFTVPFSERPALNPWLIEYFYPGYQLNPNVKNFRILTHNWGANASDISFVAEFDTWAAIEADCGKPCDDYYAAHPNPEEGDANYEAYRKGQEVFNKYYASHRDEIYSTNMDRAVVEGVRQGPVGPAPAGN